MYRNAFRLSLLCLAGSVWSNDNIPAATPAKIGEKPPALVISSLPENFKLIIGETNTQFYLPRVKAIHALPANLPPDQVAAAYEFLTKKIETQTLPDLEFNGLKNELTVVLMKQEQKPEALAANLVKMYKDKSYDTTWRDYCVQFFGKWYPNAPDNQGRREMVDGLWDALKNERQTRIAGVASSQLCFLARNHPKEFDREKVAAACLEALQDPVCANAGKVALLQACAMLNEKKVLPEARRLAAAKRDPLVCGSAIGAIGILGDESDLALLEPFAKSQDIRQRGPALAAIYKIKQRQPKKE